ncbi:MAG: AarF/UbiB family protein [Fluviicoccus sp.]|uniref:ABC1 kinase family protein n=1 Tax=Fluviicoccus sp. TaxID=2003552 RepID=UPI002725EF9C|nr:AarF/UbiB family protein [Fluviicoccus sp.]MDO8329613.1 AarF/UbiB family protein [Fluviicoccus sp.]
MSLLDTGRDLRRLNELITILLKYGFGDLVNRFGLSGVLEQAGRLVHRPMDREMLERQPGERMRHALEEMGPTFVKLGQILATRVDLFPMAWISEFERLQDKATPIPWDTLRPRVEKSLGKSIEQVFSSIDPNPIGVASIAQVHRAVLLNGDLVALKIRKPGIRTRIDADLRLLQQAAQLANDHSTELRRYRPVDLVREFERSLGREMDFTHEARQSEQIRANLASLEWLVIPRVHTELSSSSLCVQEFIDGIPARQVARLDEAGCDRRLLARRGALAAWKMVLEDGLFHADPHPGNFLILPGNRIAMLDFGMVGKLSRTRQEQLVQMTRAVVLREPEGCAAVLASWADGVPVDEERLVADIDEIIDRYYGKALAEVNATALMLEVTALLRNHDLSTPGDIALLIKAVITLDGFGRVMDPGFDVMAEAEPLIKRMVRVRYSPSRLLRSLGMRALDLVDRVYTPPVPDKRHNGEGIDPRHLDRLAARLERSQYRLVQTWLTVAGVLCGSLLLAGRVPPVVEGVSLSGLAVLLSSGVWVVWLMLVARRHLREWE